MNDKYATSLRGFKDILPEDTQYYYLIEEAIKTITNSYFIHELRTPLLENTSVFDKSLGSQTDIVTKEMYVFNDKNGESVCLRPEGTSSIVRSAIENNLIYDRGIKKKNTGIMGQCLDMRDHKRVGLGNSTNLVLNTLVFQALVVI